MGRLFKAIITELKISKKISTQYGHFKSSKTGLSIDKNMDPIPWYTYPAIEYLTQFDYSEKSIFEWGCGNSTIFWAKRAKSIISIEDNKDWFNIVDKNKQSNMLVCLIENREKYVNKISDFNIKFDIIIIDAKYRQECADITGNYLKDNGMIIFDNSDRYPNTCKKIRENLNLIQIDFKGFGPIVNYSFITSVFLKREFSFKPIKDQPSNSICGLKEICD